MDVRAVQVLVSDTLQVEPGVVGVFLLSPVLQPGCQDVNGIDVGVVTKDTLKDLRKAYELHNDLLHAVGMPVYLKEDEREHCKEVRALYGRSSFPPTGLCVNLVFCQLKYIAEQTPYCEYQVLFDRSGTVAKHLAAVLPEYPPEAITLELRQQLSNYPFHLHDAARALARKDHAAAQSAIEKIRTLIYYAAAVRAGQHTQDAQRGWHALAPGEKWVLEHSYQHATLRSVQRLTDLYIACLTDLQKTYPIGQDLEQLRQAVPELLG